MKIRDATSRTHFYVTPVYTKYRAIQTELTIMSHGDHFGMSVALAIILSLKLTHGRACKSLS